MGLRYAVLGMLSREPNTGYGLQRLLHGSLSHVWDARLQQVYAELGKLLERGLVTVELFELPNRPNKKVYTLTAMGNEVLDEWLSGREEAHYLRDNLLVKLYCLDRLPRERTARHLEEHRVASAEALAQLRSVRGKLSRHDSSNLGERLTLEAAITREEAEVSWCERATALLEDGSELAAHRRAAEDRQSEAAGGG